MTLLASGELRGLALQKRVSGPGKCPSGRDTHRGVIKIHLIILETIKPMCRFAPWEREWTEKGLGGIGRDAEASLGRARRAEVARGPGSPAVSSQQQR